MLRISKGEGSRPTGMINVFVNPLFFKYFSAIVVLQAASDIFFLNGGRKIQSYTNWNAFNIFAWSSIAYLVDQVGNKVGIIDVITNMNWLIK